MSEIIRVGWSYYKLVTFKGINGYFIVVATALCATDVLTHRAVQVILALVAGSKFIEGLLNTDLATAKQSQIAGDTTRFYNPLTQTTEQQQKQVVSEKDIKIQ